MQKMAKSTSPPPNGSGLWTDRKSQTDWRPTSGPRIAKKLTRSAAFIHRGDECGLDAFYADAIELKKLYPQYAKFINRAITTIQNPDSKYILDRIEWMVERNADPSEFYKIPLKD